MREPKVTVKREPKPVRVPKARTEREPIDTSGTWRVGSCIIDWTGLTSVARCERCPQYSRMRFGGRLQFKVVDAHLRDEHGLTNVERVPL